MTRSLATKSPCFGLSNRRRWLGDTLAATVGLALVDPLVRAQLSAAEPSDGPEPLNRFPRMVQEFYVQRVRQIEAAAERRRAALKTKADAEAYVEDVRGKIARSFG